MIFVAIILVLEKFLTASVGFLKWVRHPPFQFIMLIWVCDSAASNLLAFKFFKALQFLLLPETTLLLYLEPCGLHQTTRIHISHLSRFCVRKPLLSISRLLQKSHYHERWLKAIAHVAKDRYRYRRCEKIPETRWNDPAVQATLLQLLRLDERQLLATAKISGGTTPADDAFRLKEYHLTRLLWCSSYSLVGDLVFHFCAPMCPLECTSAEDSLKKFIFHLTSLMEAGCPNFIPSRFTKLWPAPSYLAVPIAFNDVGGVAFSVTFQKDVSDALKTIQDTIVDESEVCWPLENSKQLVDGAKSFANPVFKVDLLIFLGVGDCISMYTWALFKTEADPKGRGGSSKTMRSNLKKSKKVAGMVEVALRDLLRPESGFLKLVLLFAEGCMLSRCETILKVRAAAFCAATDVWHRICIRLTRPPLCYDDCEEGVELSFEQLCDLVCDFLSYTHCCIEGDGFTEYVQRHLSTLSVGTRGRGGQAHFFQLVHRSLFKRMRNASLEEEGWHAFGKKKAAGNDSWATLIYHKYQ